MNAVMDAKNIEPQYLGGMRVTDADTLAVARQVFLETNLKLCERLEQLGTPARPLAAGIFQARCLRPVWCAITPFLGIRPSLRSSDGRDLDGRRGAGRGGEAGVRRFGAESPLEPWLSGWV